MALYIIYLVLNLPVLTVEVVILAHIVWQDQRREMDFCFTLQKESSSYIHQSNLFQHISHKEILKKPGFPEVSGVS